MTKAILVNTLILSALIATNAACSLKTTTTTTNTTITNANIANAEPEGTPASGSAESPALAASALVADLYKQHDAKKSPFFQTKNRAIVDKFFTKSLADLIWKDANNSSGEVGAIDGDPLYNAQDTEIKNFSVGKADLKGDAANVPVTFTNFSEKMTINFALKQVNNAWKIENILYADGDSLMKWLRDAYSGDTKTPAPARNTEFEGKFRVGPTFCIVKPIKMAFEVTWAKGTGAETFTFTEGFTFESVTNDDVPNRFEFDDENYTTGTFYRNDGKTFPVKRAK